MKPLNTIIVAILVFFIAISLYVYQQSHLKAALWTFGFYYIVWEMMVSKFMQIDRHGDLSDADDGNRSGG